MSASLISLVGLQKTSCENVSSGLETPVPKPAECHDLECCTMNAKRIILIMIAKSRKQFVQDLLDLLGAMRML